MARDVMTIRLQLRRIRVVDVLVDTISRLVVEVESTWSVSRCRWCGFKTRLVHDVRPRRVRDRRIGDREVTLVWQRRRFVCGNCDQRHLEEHPEFEGKLTRRLARQLVADVGVMSVSAVARREGVSWHKVMGLVSSWAERVAEHRRRQRCRILLVDETSIRRRHRYVTVVLNGETGHILAMFEHRSTAALAGFFREQTPGWRRGVKVSSPTGPELISPPSTPGYPTPATSWTGSMSSAGSQQGSPRCAVTYNADPTEPSPPSTLTCSEPASLSYEEATNSAMLKQPTSTSSWPTTPGYRSPGTPSKSSTASTWPRTTTAHSPRFAASLISTPPASFPSSASRRHRHRLGRRNPAWHRCGRPSNGRLEGANNLLQVLRRVAHGFTNPNNYAARGLLLI